MKGPESQSPSTPASGPARVLVALWMGCDFGRDANEGIRKEIANRGLSWRIRFTNAEHSFLSALKWMLREGRIDGVITCFPVPSALSALRRADVPVVLIDRGGQEVPESARSGKLAQVTLDVERVVRAAVDHFFQYAAFRSAGFVESHGDEGWSRLRGDACMAEFARRGLRGRRFRHRTSGGPDFDRLADWLVRLEKPAAVFAANDATAAEIIDLCDARGLAVPRNIAVLGMDDDPAYCLRCEPNLSSVHFDGVSAGRLAARALAAMMGGEGAPPPETLVYGATTIMRRASTGAVSTAGALVQKAVDFIDANALHGICLSDVVRHLGVSRALTTLRFRQLRGESVEHAIRRRRVEEAKRLLETTDKTTDEIADICHFSCAGALRRAFASETGRTLVQWRQEHPFRPMP